MGGRGSNEILFINMQHIGIAETGKLTVSQPESFMVKFEMFFLCGEDGL